MEEKHGPKQTNKLLTVSPTDAWQKNSSIGESSWTGGSNSLEEVLC